MEYLDIYKTIPEITEQAKLFINDGNLTISDFKAALKANTSRSKNSLTFTDETEKLWEG